MEIDWVEKPPHYQTDSGLEAIEVIKAFFRTNYNLGQVFKYIAREGKKFDAIEDLKKARWYLDKEIEWREESEDKSPAVRLWTTEEAKAFRDRILADEDTWEPKIGDRVKIETEGHYDGKTGKIIEILDGSPHYPFKVMLDDLAFTYFHRGELRYFNW